MKLTLTELRTMIRTIMIEQIGHAGFYDSYFVNDIIPMLKERELLPDGVGRLIGYGNEAVIFFVWD